MCNTTSLTTSIVISCVGAASSAAVETTVDRLSNPYLLQQLVDKTYVPPLLGNSLSILAFRRKHIFNQNLIFFSNWHVDKQPMTSKNESFPPL